MEAWLAIFYTVLSSARSTVDRTSSLQLHEHNSLHIYRRYDALTWRRPQAVCLWVRQGQIADWLVENKTDKVYVLVPQKGGTKGVNAELVQYAAQTVKLTGNVVEKGG